MNIVKTGLVAGVTTIGGGTSVVIYQLKDVFDGMTIEEIFQHEFITGLWDLNEGLDVYSAEGNVFRYEIRKIRGKDLKFGAPKYIKLRDGGGASVSTSAEQRITPLSDDKIKPESIVESCKGIKGDTFSSASDDDWTKLEEALYWCSSRIIFEERPIKEALRVKGLKAITKTSDRYLVENLSGILDRIYKDWVDAAREDKPKHVFKGLSKTTNAEERRKLIVEDCETLLERNFMDDDEKLAEAEKWCTYGNKVISQFLKASTGSGFKLRTVLDENVWSTDSAAAKVTIQNYKDKASSYGVKLVVAEDFNELGKSFKEFEHIKVKCKGWSETTIRNESYEDDLQRFGNLCILAKVQSPAEVKG